MGILRKQNGTDEFILETHNLIGRGPMCTLVVNSTYASSEHLSLDWIENSWYVRDLGTTNGTHIDDEPVQPKKPHKCRLGQKIFIGETGECWSLVDASAPLPMLVSVKEGKRVTRLTEHGVIVLPSKESPEVSVYLNGEGKWMLEQYGNRMEIESGTTFTACNSIWRLSAPTQWEYTMRNRNRFVFKEAETTFYVSEDEETVEMSVSVGNDEIWIPNRSHNYMLLTLARERLKDVTSDGWVMRETLEKMLKADETTINVWIYRARKSISDCNFAESADIIERQNGAIRIGGARVTVKSLKDKKDDCIIV